MKTSMAQCLDQQQRRSNFSSQRACQFQNILCVLPLGKYRPINAVAEGNNNVVFLKKKNYCNVSYVAWANLQFYTNEEELLKIFLDKSSQKRLPEG